VKLGATPAAVWLLNQFATELAADQTGGTGDQDAAAQSRHDSDTR